MKYRKKPIVIDAIQWTGDNTEEVREFVGKDLYGELYIESKVYSLAFWNLEGPTVAFPGDWIIKGANGEFYPCKQDIFEETYEIVEE